MISFSDVVILDEVAAVQISSQKTECECTNAIATHLIIPDLAAIVRKYASVWDEHEIAWMYFSSINTHPLAYLSYDIKRQTVAIMSNKIRCEVYPTCIDDMTSLAIARDIENTMINSGMPLDDVRQIMILLHEIAANAREYCKLHCLCSDQGKQSIRLS